MPPPELAALVGQRTGTIVSGVAHTASDISVVVSGTYYWKVEYLGNTFNNPFTTGCGGVNDEKTVVTVSGS